MSLSETKNDEKTTNLTKSTNKILTELTDKEAPKIKFENATEGTTNIQNEAQEGLDKEKKTYRNPKSGLTYNLYDQNDPRRRNKRKNRGSTMNESGCLLTSASVIH